MNERSIVMSARSVLDILDGRKTQHRCVVDPQPGPHVVKAQVVEGRVVWWDNEGLLGHTEEGPECPYGTVGDLVWIQERWAVDRGNDHTPAEQLSSYEIDSIHYPATDEPGSFMGLIRPPDSMPKWASRTTLELTDIRAQRLQDISEEGAIAEGLRRNVHGQWLPAYESAAGWIKPDRCLP